MAAAPCDYELAPSKQKIKTRELLLSLKKAQDIAAWVGEHKPENSRLVVFAAETENAEQNAKQKLTDKRADMAVLNDVTQNGAGFDIDTNIVTVITAECATRLPLMKKSDVANALLDMLSGK